MTMTAEELQEIVAEIKEQDPEAGQGQNLAPLFGVKPSQFSRWLNGHVSIPRTKEAGIRRVIAERWGIGSGAGEKKPIDAPESTKQAAPVSYPSEKRPLRRRSPRAPRKPEKSRVVDLPKLTVYLELEEKKLLDAARLVRGESASRLLVSAFRKWIKSLPSDQRQRIETIAENL